jgi:hypothetical protein
MYQRQKPILDCPVSSIPQVHPKNAGPKGIQPHPQANYLQQTLQPPMFPFSLGHRIKGFGASCESPSYELRRSFQIGTKADAERTHREDGGLKNQE